MNTSAEVREGDCLKLLADVPDASVGLIATDPPFHVTKKAEWDKQWASDADYLAWIGRLCEQWRRVLKPNGSLYVFASPQMATRVECKVAEYFSVLNNVRWLKRDGWHQKAEKEACRSYLSPWEAVIFAEQYGTDSGALAESQYGLRCDELRGSVFEPLRLYLAGERNRAGWTTRQWELPTEENYEWLRGLFGDDYLRREYEDLRREYEDLRREYEDLRRPFSLCSNVPYTDVWDFETVQAYPGKHPCEKPRALAEHIVSASSRPGDTVLDCFAGSGVFGEAAVLLGRRFLGMEQDPKWCARARQRVAQAGASLFMRAEAFDSSAHSLFPDTEGA